MSRRVPAWTVRVQYEAQDKETRWGETNHTRKGEAQSVWRRLASRGRKAELLHKGRVIVRMDRAQILEGADLKAYESFLTQDTGLGIGSESDGD